MSKSRNIYAKRGTGTISSAGHRMIGVGGTKRGEHVLIVERTLGKLLRKGVEVHHINNMPADNRHENLVVCSDKAYHKLLHMRQAAYDACGHYDWRKCSICKKWEPIELLTKSVTGWLHRECRRQYMTNYRERKHHASTTL